MLVVQVCQGRRKGRSECQRIKKEKRAAEGPQTIYQGFLWRLSRGRHKCGCVMNEKNRRQSWKTEQEQKQGRTKMKGKRITIENRE